MVKSQHNGMQGVGQKKQDRVTYQTKWQQNQLVNTGTNAQLRESWRSALIS